MSAKRAGKPQTQDKAIISAPPPDLSIFPMRQHIGIECQPCTEPGQRVLIGQKIGISNGFVSSPVHSSVSGIVQAVAPHITISGTQTISVTVRNDYADEWDPSITPHGDVDALSPREIIDIIKESGIVGLGGAAFPTHVKLSPPPGSPIDTLLINGAECEPFLTTDHRLMLESPETVALGLRLLMKAIGVKKAVIGIEDNKPDAAASLRPHVAGVAGASIVMLRAKYPQGSEKQLIEALTGRQVPSGALPASVGCIVVNVGTAAAVCDAVVNGRPLVNTLITVAGAVSEPKNLLARVGTPIIELINCCGGLPSDAARVVAGGPMMGVAVYDLSAPVQKSTSAILVLTNDDISQGKTTSCIRCARCQKACPILLQPMILNRLAALLRWDDAEKQGVLDCIECGACSYVCPAKIDLTTNLRVAKRSVLARRSKN